MREAETWQLVLSTTDADGDAITYAATNLPAGATFSPATGELTWTPNLFQAGIYEGIVLEASDGHRTSSETISIVVPNTNQAPILLQPPVLSTRERTLLEFPLAATDIDGDPLYFYPVTSLPEGARLDERTGAFSWTPSYEQSGTYVLQLGVQDCARIDAHRGRPHPCCRCESISVHRCQQPRRCAGTSA